MVIAASIVPEGANVLAIDDPNPILVRHNLELSEVRGEYEKFSSASFFSCACFTRSLRSAEFSRVRAPSTGNPVGWIIPSLYFSEPHQFYETRLLADFAYAGFIQFWTYENFSSVREHISAAHLRANCEFSEILPEDFALAVFSKESFKKSKLSMAQLNLSLLRQGIWSFTGQVAFPVLQIASRSALNIEYNALGSTSFTANIKTYSVPAICKSVEKLLASLLSMAHNEFSGVGGFLYLYQVAEYLMEVNFSESVRDASREGLPAWKLKKKLTEAASEPIRLRKIAQRASESGASHLVFDVLGEACCRFIDACNLDEKVEGRHWIDNVYSVRNILVHNHLAVLRSGASTRLEEINALLHRAALELVFHYE